jgi:membrane protease YdiL (CAAX protease family)
VLDNPRWGLIDIIMVYLGIMGMAILANLLPIHSMSDKGYYLYSYLVQFTATIVFVYLFAVLFPRGKWRDLGVRKARWKDIGRYGIMGGCLLIIMVLVMGLVIKYFQPNLAPQQIEEMLRSVTKLSDFIVIVITGVVLAPIAEELFYRGMIYPLFRKHLGPGGGALMAGLVFGLAHWDLWRAIPLAIGGAILCYIYEKSNSILVSMVAHGVWNGFMCLTIYFSIFKGLV